MKIPITVLSAIETALNAWLKLDGESLQKCARIEGKIIRLHITGFDLNLFFLPAVSGIQVMGNYPYQTDTDSNTHTTPDGNGNTDNSNNTETRSTSHLTAQGEVDATIHGSPMALMRLSTSVDSGATLLSSDIDIDGDMRVAEAFSNILKEVDIDWEELLSKLVGDIIAHQAGQVVRSGSDWFKQSVDAMQRNTSEYLSEESQLTPAEAELSYYMDQVDTLRADTERLTARVQRLNTQLESQPTTAASANNNQTNSKTSNNKKQG